MDLDSMTHWLTLMKPMLDEMYADWLAKKEAEGWTRTPPPSPPPVETRITRPAVSRAGGINPN